MNPSITELLKRTNLNESEKEKLVAELKKHFQQRKARGKNGKSIERPNTLSM
ncbi:hypothetical protein M2353_000530 [Bacillus aerius]|nr:hypothetical protein [Bacillus aerius]